MDKILIQENIEFTEIDNLIIFKIDFKLIKNRNLDQIESKILRFSPLYSKDKFPINETIFEFNSCNIALLTFDFRAVSLNNFQYGSDWEIGIYLTNHSLVELKDKIPEKLPDLFLKASANNSINRVIKFSLLSYKDQFLMIEIIIKNTNYSSFAYLFYNTLNVKITKPNRALLNEKKQFFFVITPDISIELPINLPSSKLGYYPNVNIAFIQEDLQMHKMIQGENRFDPNTLYWTSTVIENKQLILPYLPYFSNCKGFDSFIPLISLTEQNKNCILYSEQDTDPISPYRFGSYATADLCSEIEIDCIFDEINPDQTSNPRWFENGGQAQNFFITKEPYDLNLFNPDFQIEENNLIPVTINLGFVKPGKFPKLVNINIGYYQIDKVTKKILSASMVLDNYQERTTDIFEYKLVFSFTPMTHSEITKVFAFPWTVYLILYVGIYIVGFTITGIFWLYKRIFTRNKKYKFVYLKYITKQIPQACYGGLLAFIIIMSFLIFSSILMRGYLWNQKIFGDDYDSPFDIFNQDDPNLDAIRAGRCGVVFLIGGIYFLWKASQLLIPKTIIKEKEESYNGNILNNFSWDQVHFYVLILISTNFVLMVIQFSFSQEFSKQLYTYMAIIKTLFSTFEFILEIVSGNKLLIMPMGSAHGLTVNFATFGAENFFDFLNSFLIGLMISIIEKHYFVKVMKIVQDYATGLPTRINKYIKKTFNIQEDDDEEIDEKKDEKLKEKKKTIKDINQDIEESTTTLKHHNSDSDILLTEEVIENLASSGTSEDEYNNSPKDGLKEQIKKNLTTTDPDDLDPFEQKVKNRLFEELPIKKYDTAKSQNMDLTSHITKLDDYKYQEQLDYYSEFVNDTTGNFYFPILLLFVWAFYDETNIVSNYNISKEGFIYYFLFAIITIPFQFFIDILFYNVISLYHGIQFYTYLEFCEQHFKNRNERWVLNDMKPTNDVEQNSLSVYQFCFSSQFFFSISISLTGIFLISLGIQVQMSNKPYNLFSDDILVLLIIFWVTFCYLFEKLCLLVYDWLRIWSIKTEKKVIANIKKSKKESIINKLLIDTNQTEAEKNLKLFSEWNKVLILKEKEERLKEINIELAKDKFNSDNFRKKFLNKNNKWLKENLRLIFTPRTLKYKRATILNVFSNIYGNFEQEKMESDGSNHSGFIVEENRENKIEINSKSFDILWKYWYFRANRIRLIRSQIAGVMERNTNKYCEFCGLNWGLRAETIENIEDIFLKFWFNLLENEKQNNKIANNEKRYYESKDIIKWQRFYQQNAHFRTICFECMNEIWERNKLNNILKQKEKKEEHINRNEIKIKILAKENQEKKDQILFLSPKRKKSIRAILLYWIKLSRLSRKINNINL